MKQPLTDRLSTLVQTLPIDEQDKAARRFVRYLEIVIAIADEDLNRSESLEEGLTDEEEPPTLSYSI